MSRDVNLASLVVCRSTFAVCGPSLVVRHVRRASFVVTNITKVLIVSFTLSFIRFSYYTEGNAMTFKAKGNYKKVPLVTFKTEIKKDVLTGTAYAIGKTTSIKFNELMASFGVAASSIPDFIKNGLK